MSVGLKALVFGLLETQLLPKWQSYMKQRFQELTTERESPVRKMEFGEGCSWGMERVTVRFRNVLGVCA